VTVEQYNAKILPKSKVWAMYPFMYMKNKDMDGELWRGNKGLEISNKGRVRVDGKIIQQTDKYSNGNLYLGGTEKLVYRLVARFWLEKPQCDEDDVLDIHHINNNCYDNSVENLVWLPRKQIHKKINHRLFE